MPTTSDLQTGVIYEGVNGERWRVQDVMQTSERINVELVKLKVEELIIKE